MKRIYKPLLVSTGYLILGLAIILAAGQLKLSGRIFTSFIILSAFILLNLTFSQFFHLKDELRQFWTLKKIWLLPAGIMSGAVIAILPLFIGLICTDKSLADLKFSGTFFTLPSVVATLIIVSWEELWFRGIFVNYCSRYFSAPALSVGIGSLFTLVHLLNPAIDFTRSGPALFFAGSLLTLLYIHFKSIWLPLGLHFGNNFVNATYQVESGNGKWFGTDGYMSSIILALAFFSVVQLHRRSRLSEREKKTRRGL